MMAATDDGDVKESAVHQPLSSPDKPLVVVVLQWASVSTPHTTALHLVNGAMTSPYFVKNFTDDSAPAH